MARGRVAIVAAWLEDPDATGTYTGEYRPPLVSGDDAIAVGISRYYSDSTRTTLESEFHNSGCCASAVTAGAPPSPSDTGW